LAQAGFTLKNPNTLKTVSSNGDRSPTFDWTDKEDLYRFLKDAQSDEVEAEIRFSSCVKEVLLKNY